MKKILNLILIVLFVSPAMLASDGYDVSYEQAGNDHRLQFTPGNYSLSTRTVDGKTYSVIDFEGNIYTRKAGYAELPYIHAAVMLQADKNVDLQLSGENYVDVQLDHPLLPSRGVIYRDQDPSSIPYTTDPKSITDTWYPAGLAVNTDPYILRDVRGTNVYVYPFRYNAARQVLRVYTSVTLTLAVNNTPAVNPLEERNSIVYEMDAIYRSVFINYGQSSDNLTIGEMGDILVVLTDRDLAAMDPYIQWKREKGFNVSTEVVATGTNVNSLVQDAYNNNNNLLYVQLVGDWNDIKCNTLNGGAPPMDPQVGCVAGGDDVPDIAVGRFSAENPGHVTTQVDKVIAYEKNAQMAAAWYATATGIASDEGVGDDGEYDFEHIDVIYYDKLDTTTYDAYNEIYDPGASSSDVLAAVNAGTSIINYCGHGSPTSWGTTGFNNSHVANLSNGDMTPWIVSVACNNGDFHTGTCFAEAWQRHEGGGSVMFLGASISQPWDPPMRGQDYFADMLTGGYDYNTHAGQNGISTTEGRTTLGAIIFNGLVLMTTESGGSSDWNTAKTWNLFGDPSMQARTAAPAELSLSNNVVMLGVPFETTVTSNSVAVEGAMLALSQNGNYFSGMTDANGNIVLSHGLNPGNALLVVTAFNKETIYENIVVIPPDGPYVMYAGHTVNDANGGNSNGMLDYGESAALTILMTNVGTEDATNVEVELTSADAFVQITAATANYGTIASGDTVAVSDAFATQVANDIPDLHAILFDVEASGDETWSSSFSEIGHAPVLSYSGYSVVDPAGNGNGKIDPGETVELVISLSNEGSAGADGVVGQLSTLSEYIEISEPAMTYGPIASGSSVERSYTVVAADDTPQGHAAGFTIEVNANQGISASDAFFIIIGQIPVLIIDLDGNANSSSEMQTCFDNLSVGSEMVNSWPDEMSLYSSIFVCLGIYPDNHTLSAAEGQELADYLSAGGNIYMEGGDTWAYDEPTAVHPMFSIEGLEDGGNDLGFIPGQEGTFTDGLLYYYSGDDNWIDRIAPLDNAFTIFRNQDPEYINAVARDAGAYRTIGSSFEFGGLEDADATKEYLMHKYLQFFGIGSTYVGQREFPEHRISSLKVYPNPFSGLTNIAFHIGESGNVRIEVLNHIGQVVESNESMNMAAGEHQLFWDATGLAKGIYFIRISTPDESSTVKAIVMD